MNSEKLKNNDVAKDVYLFAGLNILGNSSINYFIVAIAIVVAINGFFLFDLTGNYNSLFIGVGFGLFLISAFGLNSDLMWENLSKDRIEAIRRLYNAYADRDIKMVSFGGVVYDTSNSVKDEYLFAVLTRANDQAGAMTNEDWYFMLTTFLAKARKIKN